MTFKLRSLALLVALAAPLPAQAGPVAGARLEIKTPDTGNRKLVFKSKDNVVDSGNFDSSGDPRCAASGGGGGSLRINGGAGNDFTIPLPCEGWITTNGGPGNTFNTDYKYKDTSGTTCRQVSVKHGHSIKVVCKGPQMAYVLGTVQGDIDVTLRLGSLPVRDCATFGPAPTNVIRDGSDGRRYRAKDAPRPASCTSSPSGAFLDVDR